MPVRFVIDTMPSGFRYVDESATLDGEPVTPIVNGRQVRFENLQLGAYATREIRLDLLVLSTAGPGTHKNTASVTDQFGNPVAKDAQAVVEILAEPVFDCGEIIGTVFDDHNRNGYQDDGESGLPARGTAKGGLTTDSHGRLMCPAPHCLTSAPAHFHHEAGCAHIADWQPADDRESARNPPDCRQDDMYKFRASIGRGFASTCGWRLCRQWRELPNAAGLTDRGDPEGAFILRLNYTAARMNDLQDADWSRSGRDQLALRRMAPFIHLKSRHDRGGQQERCRTGQRACGRHAWPEDRHRADRCGC